jgi:hypothetical protein
MTLTQTEDLMLSKLRHMSQKQNFYQKTSPGIYLHTRSNIAFTS